MDLYSERLTDFEKFIDAVEGLLKYLGMNKGELRKEVKKRSDSWRGQEAATEVLMDRLIKMKGDPSQALLTVTSISGKKTTHPEQDRPRYKPLPENQKVTYPEQDRSRSEPLLENQEVVLSFVNTLLQKGASRLVCDDNKQCSLHHAVKGGFSKIVSRLLEDNPQYVLMQEDKNRKSPLHLALDYGDDKMAALILKRLPHDEVRHLFLVGQEEKGPEVKAAFSFCQILKSTMTDTALRVLDCMIDIDEDSHEVTLYYSLLESDSKGRCREHPNFDSKDHTVFQLIAKQENKTVKCHVLMRQLIKQKWNTFARTRFIWKFIGFLLSILLMTFAAVSGVMASDPTRYDSPVDFVRAACELGALTAVFVKCVAEVYQIYRARLQYWTEIYNYIDLASLCCIVAVVPLRWNYISGQWIVFGVGYLIWTFRVFKYAVVTRKTGAYSLILWQLITQEFPQFTIVFSVILLAFSGSFILVLKGESSLHVHDETSNFWEILITGIRILIEGQPVVDYTGPDGFKVLSAIFMAVFLFVSCVVLLNILIAQLSDRYNKVQQDAEQEFVLNRIWIISRYERNSLLNQCCQLENLKLTETWNLDKWFSKVEEDNKIFSVHTVKDSLESTQHEISSVRNELSRLERTLRDVQKDLKKIIESETGRLASNTTESSSL